MSAAPAPALALAAGARPGRWLHNRVLALLLASGLAAALGGAFLTLAPNRLVTGQGLALAGLLVGGWRWLLAPAALLVLAVFLPAQHRTQAAVALAASTLLAGLVALAGTEATRLLAGAAPAAAPLARVSLGSSFWVLATLTWLAASDALQRLHLGRAAQALAQAAIWLPVAVLLYSGALDSLSLLQEHANRQDVFQAAGWRHLQIVASALLTALFIGLPLGVAAARHAPFSRRLLAGLTLIQTVPSIALFGLLIAPLAWLGAAWPASGIAGIGLLPAVIALALYALLPIVHGTLAGLQQVPASVIDAATGMGLTPRQRFWQVQVPLALPLLLSAVRLSTVQMVGMAVVAALIGAGGYGALVFQGLLSSALDLVLLGVLPVVALALLVDAGFKLLGAVLPGAGRLGAGLPDESPGPGR